MSDVKIPAVDFDANRALKTIAEQVAVIFQMLPGLLDTMKSVVSQQQEHERRIIRLEGAVIRLEALVTTLQVPK
jgi:hypothetical protein